MLGATRTYLGGMRRLLRPLLGSLMLLAIAAQTPDPLGYEGLDLILVDDRVVDAAAG